MSRRSQSRQIALMPMPSSAPPFSYLLAAWVSTGPSDSANLARDLMGRSDWVHAPGLVYPLIVVVLFVSEATEQTAASHREWYPATSAA